MVTGGPALAILGIFFVPARLLLLLLSGVYAVTGFYFARRAAHAAGANSPLTLAAMGIMHLTYGAGFIAGGWREHRRLRHAPARVSEPLVDSPS